MTLSVSFAPLAEMSTLELQPSGLALLPAGVGGGDDSAPWVLIPSVFSVLQTSLQVSFSNFNFGVTIQFPPLFQPGYTSENHEEN